MNYYIDFDNTLYETANLTKKMLSEIAKAISKEKDLRYEDVLENITPQFNSTVDNIFTFSEKVARLYGVNEKIAIQSVNDAIANGADLVFEDAKRFVERKRANGDNLVILTYIADGNQEYQLKKVMGSRLANYFNQIIITNKYKFELDLDYKNGIFIDDDPRDLNGLLAKNPIKVIRIRKPNNKRSKIDMENSQIEEFTSFDEIKI